jgi:hypothetical protein
MTAYDAKKCRTIHCGAAITFSEPEREDHVRRERAAP